MKYFRLHNYKVPVIKLTEYRKLADNSKTDNWQWIEQVGDFMDDQSYVILKYLKEGPECNKFYKTCWGIFDGKGKIRPTGRVDHDTDYYQLKEVNPVVKVAYDEVPYKKAVCCK